MRRGYTGGAGPRKVGRATRLALAQRVAWRVAGTAVGVRYPVHRSPECSASLAVGVSQSQLSRWLAAARTVEPMTKKRPSDRVAQASGNARSAAEKVRVVMAAAALGPDELGAFHRSELATSGERN